MNAFTLMADNWYALEFAHAPGGNVSSRFLPLFLQEVIPRKTGRGLLDLKGETPAGALRLSLRVWQRAPRHLTAGLGGENSVVIRPIHFAWLARFHPNGIEGAPLPPPPRDPGDLITYLERRLPHQISRRAATAYDEDAILIAWALRFDGYKYVERELGGDDSVFTQYEEEERVPDEAGLQLALFFRMQRYLYKWGGEMLPRHSKEWRFFRTLFFAVADKPTPPAFRADQYYTKWLHNYDPYREQCMATVRAVHAATEYGDAFADAPPLRMENSDG
jgi:hypothetical protein